MLSRWSVAIRVHSIEELASNLLEVMVHGEDADAKYVKGRLEWVRGVKVDIKTKEAMPGFRFLFARSSGEHPLTRKIAVELLKPDSEIELVLNDATGKSAD